MVTYPLNSKDPADYYKFIEAYKKQEEIADRSYPKFGPISRAKRAIKLLYEAGDIQEIREGFILKELNILIAAQANRYCYLRPNGKRSVWYPFGYLSHFLKGKFEDKEISDILGDEE